MTATPMADRGLVRSSVVVAIGTAVSRVTGFLRVASIAYALGVTAVAGTYSYANETPNIIYELLLGGVLTATLVPVFVRHFERRDDDAIDAVVSFALVGLVAITVLGILFAPWIVRLYTLRVHGSNRAGQQALATDLLRLFMPQMFFYGVTALAAALLNAKRRFAAAAFAPALNNVVVIAVFLSFPHFLHGPLTVDNVRHDTSLVLLLGLGTTAGIAAMALVLVPALHRAGVRLRFVLDWKHAAVAQIVRLSGWTIGYVIANQIALWVVLVFANGKTGGAFVYLSAYTFFQLPHGLFAVSFMTTAAPEMASAAAANDLAALRRHLSTGLRLTATVVLPAAAVYLGLARPIIVAGLQRGAFSAHDAALVANTLTAFAVGLLPFSLYLFALRAFYSLHDTRTPFLLNSFENVVNVVLVLALFDSLGIRGLAWAFSGAYLVAAVATLLVLRHRVGGLDGRRLLNTVVRVAVVAGAVAAATWGIARAGGWSTPGQAIVTSVAGVLVAAMITLGGLWLLRVDELRLLIHRRNMQPLDRSQSQTL